MKYITSVALLFTAVLLLTGGGITSSLNPPIEEDDIDTEINQFLVGNWEGVYENKPIKVQFTVKEDADSLDMKIEIADEEGKSYQPLFPLIGTAAKIGNRQFFCIFPNLEAIQKAGGYANESFLLTAGRFYLFELEKREDELIVRILSFAVYENEEFQPIAHELRLNADGIIINPTEDLRLFLERGQYEVKDFGTLKRADAKPDKDDKTETAAKTEDTAAAEEK